MVEEQEKKKTDEEILFSERKIAGFTVKPWSFGTLFDISGLLDTIFDKIAQKEIVLEFDFDEGLTKELPKLLRIASIAAPEVKAVLALTVNVDEKEIEELDMVKGMELLSAVFRQNFSILKNAFGLSLSLAGELKDEMGS
uniref:Tail assembly chaperone n=1 Tax=viral metagenome TaxID=1070528 RepID=A0A6M3KG28_9ZZZZ